VSYVVRFVRSDITPFGVVHDLALMRRFADVETLALSLGLQRGRPPESHAQDGRCRTLCDMAGPTSYIGSRI
jgi:hypothetical protein